MAINIVILQKRGDTIPPLYESGVVYRKEQRRRERWTNIEQTLKAGWGDCEDLAAWRTAELIVDFGEDAYAFAKRTGRKKFHALVCADGEVEDPSRKLGMGRRKNR